MAENLQPVRGTHESTGRDVGALLNRQRFDAAGERRGDVDEFTLEVALPASPLVALATHDGQERQDHK
jgi:hypothetical protein